MPVGSGDVRRLTDVFEMPRDVEQVDVDLHGLPDEREVLQEAVGMQDPGLRIGRGLDDHLVRGEDLGGRRVLGGRRLGPQQVDVRVESGALQAHAERADNQERDEQEFAGVCVQEEAEVSQLLLKATTQPQHASVADSFALQQSLT